jgi:hypothetical protein
MVLKNKDKLLPMFKESAAEKKLTFSVGEEKGNNIIYIYGGRDPWSAPQVELNGKTNAMMMIFQTGNHFTSINTFLPGKKANDFNTPIYMVREVGTGRRAHRPAPTFFPVFNRTSYIP